MLKVTIINHKHEESIRYVNSIHHMYQSGGITLDKVVHQMNDMIQEVEREYIPFNDCLMITVEETKSGESKTE